MILNENQKEMYKDCIFLNEFEDSIIKKLNSDLKELIDKNKSKYKDFFINCIRYDNPTAVIFKVESTEVYLYAFKSLPLKGPSLHEPENLKKTDILYHEKFKHREINRSHFDKELYHYTTRKKYDSLFK